LESYQERKFQTAPSNPVRSHQNRNHHSRRGALHAPAGCNALKKIPTPAIAPLTHHRFIIGHHWSSLVIIGHPNRGAPHLGAALGRVQRAPTGTDKTDFML
jgi:hypothetical protein